LSSQKSGAANRPGVTRSSPWARRPTVQQRSRTGFIVGLSHPRVRRLTGVHRSPDAGWRRLDRLPARCSVFKDHVPVGTQSARCRRCRGAETPDADVRGLRTRTSRPDRTTYSSPWGGAGQRPWLLVITTRTAWREDS